MDDLAGFHRSMQANPEEGTTGLVFADYMEEGGHPAVADVIRRHVERFGRPTLLDHHDIDPSKRPGDLSSRFAHWTEGGPAIWVHQRSAINPIHTYGWGATRLGDTEAIRMLHGLHAEGVPLDNTAKRWLALRGEPLPSPERLGRAYQRFARDR